MLKAKQLGSVPEKETYPHASDTEVAIGQRPLVRENATPGTGQPLWASTTRKDTVTARPREHIHGSNIQRGQSGAHGLHVKLHERLVDRKQDIFFLRSWYAAVMDWTVYKIAYAFSLFCAILLENHVSKKNPEVKTPENA